MKYQGALERPIVANDVRGLLADEARIAEATRQVNLMLEKLPQLAQAHGVEPGDWFALVMAMAKEHVPGFRVIAKAGRDELWSDLEKAELKIEVDAYRKAGRNLKQAIEAVLANGRWEQKRPTHSALDTHYKRADKSLVAMVLDARAFRAINDER
ncbi:hypothetical protein [Variovorax boronicumulans]|uniref:hypothetical protein n=1 Tax=Variovorax boronicumulans TaxID=436515 RepID=UPI000A48CFCC|nr:hypothetical protein [Variovorax boronicumulans]